MAGGGRPQGAPKGATDAANALAQFLRELTDGMGVREMADRYEGGKTLWGEYRSGARIVPLGRLNAVVKDRVRDARGREAMLARARRLHEEALTAEAEGRPAPGLDEALRQAEKDVDQMGRLVTLLLAKIDTLERAALTSVSASGEETADPVSVRQLDELRRRVSEAQQIEQAARRAYEDARAAARVGSNADDGSGTGEHLVVDLVRLHDSVTRHQDALAQWQDDSVDTSPLAAAGSPSSPAMGPGDDEETDVVTEHQGTDPSSPPPAPLGAPADRQPRGETAAPQADPEGAPVDGLPETPPGAAAGHFITADSAEPDPTPTAPAADMAGAGDGDPSPADLPDSGDTQEADLRTDAETDADAETETETEAGAGAGAQERSLRVRFAAPAVMLLVAASLIGGIVIGVAQVSDDSGPDQSLKLPSASPRPERGPDLPGTKTSSPPADSTADTSAPPTPRISPAPSGSRSTASTSRRQVGTVYAVTPDRQKVMRWSAGEGWTVVGGIAGKVYAGPAGVFATNPHSGDIYARNQAGAWRWIGSPGAQFLVNGSNLYALKPGKDAVMHWTGDGARWDNIGGPANELYAGGAGLFATFPDKNNDLYRYAGPGLGWTVAGGPGSEFAIGPDYIAGLAPDRSQIWMADAGGSGWHKISGPAGHVYAGGAGLFATDPDNGQLLKYTGTPHSWTPVGEAGTAHEVDDRSVYRIAKKTGAVERWTGGTRWTALGRTAGDIDTN
ncbi:hypothetical protein ACGFMM_34505 [Streptomyces sp. NPDC048604]|uniref:hypothetical protein n=1 Tax=Streptomyces sp. NPDC048604 TaxID=3365578 RepID=UPI003722AED1